VSAKDKATGKENKITIKANSGLSEGEIDKMVKDAELHADEDKLRVELTQARNNADAMVHTVEKSLKDHGDKLDADEKSKVEAALNEVREALKADDKDRIESATAALTTASQKLGEKMYADAQAAAAASGAAGAAGAGAAGAAGGGFEQDDGKREEVAEDVVDAEFKEVKRDA
jgi:molecular chaperone DnaK